MQHSVASRGQPQLGAGSRQLHGLKQLKNARLQAPMQVRAQDPAASLCQQKNMYNSTSMLQAAATELVIPTPELVIPKYCESVHQTRRRPTRTITVSTGQVLQLAQRPPFKLDICSWGFVFADRTCQGWQ